MSDRPPTQLHVGDQIAEVVSVMIREMRRRGVQVAGSGKDGSFSISIPGGGTIRGTFKQSGESLEISILSRPSSVSCVTIESKIQDYILDAKAAIKSGLQ